MFFQALTFSAKLYFKKSNAGTMLVRPGTFYCVWQTFIRQHWFYLRPSGKTY